MHLRVIRYKTPLATSTGAWGRVMPCETFRAPRLRGEPGAWTLARDLADRNRHAECISDTALSAEAENTLRMYTGCGLPGIVLHTRRPQRLDHAPG